MTLMSECWTTLSVFCADAGVAAAPIAAATMKIGKSRVFCIDASLPLLQLFSLAQSLTPCLAVLLILLGDRVTRLRPVGIGPFAQLVEVSTGGERLGAVHGDGLAADPVAAPGDQEHGQVLQLLHLADAAHRIARDGSRTGLII